MLSFATQQGLLAALVFALGALALQFVPARRQWIAAGILLFVVTPLAIGGFWFSPDQWGISDWDYYFSLHHTYREIILQHKQFPLWNPVTCGGTAGLGEPEFPVLTPTFLLEFIFGIPIGVRLAIFVATALGAVGMLALGKRIGLSVIPALLAASAYAFGSVNLLEIVEGHVNIFAAMWIPWIFWSWLGAYRGQQRSFWCGLFLALTFFQGGIYLLMYTGLAFLVLPLFTRRPLQGWKAGAQAGAWGLGLAALKLIPTLLWLGQFQDAVYASSAYTVPYLKDILLGRYLHGANVLPNQGSGWHEYGAYVGPVILGLALVGLARFWRYRLMWMLVISVGLALLLSSAGPILKPIFDQLPWLPRSNISRVILFAIIPLALLAGWGVQGIQRIPKVGRWLALIFVGVAALDLMTLSYALSLQAFVIPPLVPALTPAQPPLQFTAFRYSHRFAGTDHARTYAAVQAGYGSLNYCATIGPHPAVRTIHDEGNSSVVQFDPRAAIVTAVDWSPNVVAVQGTAQTASTLSLNTNYAKGWLVNGDPAGQDNGRVAANVPAGPFNITFRYQAPGFRLGLGLSLITILFAWFPYHKMRQLWTQRARLAR
jgi:hypothetical protein